MQELSISVSNNPETSLGKGDRRTQRGKIWRQTHGKSRRRTQEKARARQRHGPKPSQIQQKNKGN
ncbi:MAG: 30S ribosomal protein THX [Acidobacteriota bacterium]|nr:30S ribosomal protein THX [Acidobacteriota bacterium]MEC8944672.1 30S ribosomal protein THX [Acidobacteriota bacterium]